MTLLSDTTADVQLVSKANLSASTGQTPAAGFRSVSGVIFGITGAGKQPVAGAGVYFDVFLDFPAAITLSDAAGRYLLCGLPEGRTVDIAVYGGIQHPGYASVSVPPGQSTGIDITLP